MAVTSKHHGLSSIVLLFVVMTVSLVGITWFRANVTGGSGQQKDIFKQSAIDDADAHLTNTRHYLHTALAIAGMNGTATTANMSGRKKKEARYRYWYCGRTKQRQIPSRTKVRNTSANFTWQYMQQRISELHGIRNNYIYRIGRLTCIEAGFKRALDSPENNNFRMAAHIRNVNVTQVSGAVSRGATNVVTNSRVLYNRYWFIYAIMKRWVEDGKVQELKNAVKTRVKQQVPDYASAENPNQCLKPSMKEENCNYPPASPEMCTQQQTKFDQAVATALQNKINELNNKDRYFKGTNVECTYSFNKKNGADYPGAVVGWGKSHSVSNPKGECSCEMVDINQDDDKEKVCDKKLYDCQTTWGTKFYGRVDITISCTDNKYRSVPRKELSRITWKMDISFKFRDEQHQNPYPATCTAVGRHSFPPLSLRQCNVPNQNPTLCRTKAVTVGQLN